MGKVNEKSIEKTTNEILKDFAIMECKLDIMEILIKHSIVNEDPLDTYESLMASLKEWVDKK